MKTHGLDARAWSLIEGVFAQHPEVEEVRLFGSRAKGSHTPQSDIDLALWGELDPLRAESIAAELDELPLPHRFDLKVFSAIRLTPLREHIERVGITVYQNSSAKSAALKRD